MDATTPHNNMFSVVRGARPILAPQTAPQEHSLRPNPTQGVKTAAVMNEEATEAGAGLEDMDMEEVVEAGREAGVAYGVDGAEGGLEQMAEEAAADEIVEGHQYFE